MAELCLFFLLLPVERPERESITCRPLIFFFPLRVCYLNAS